MDLREIEEMVKKSNDGVSVNHGNVVCVGGSVMTRKKEALISSLAANIIKTNGNDGKGGATAAPPVDSGSALQMFLDHIPISSIPGITNSASSSILELRTQDSLKDAIRLMYEKNISGAPVTDILDADSTTVTSHSDPYIGFIDFASIILWSLKECHEVHNRETTDNSTGQMDVNGFFSMLEQVPHIGQTKIGELAKSFLWDPFFPIRLEETLFHVLLLLSKHRLHVVPVIELSSYKVTGFITEMAVIQLLLQSSGLEWFDTIADKALSDFRFENFERIVSISEDKSIAEAMHILWKTRIGAIAVVEQETERLIGCIRGSDAYLLLDNDDLFINRGSITVKQFIHLDTGMEDNDPGIERGLGTLLSAGRLALKNKFIPKMNSPVTSKRTDTVKHAMEKLAETSSSFTFLVDELQQPRGTITLRDIIIQFAPPGMDSRIDGGGFFESALQQTGCNIRDGTMICDRH